MDNLGLESILIWVIGLLIIALIPATIAKSKGYSFGEWWVYGMALFIIALPHAILIGQKKDEKIGDTGSSVNRKCPKCGKLYDSSWGVCINDGEKLVAIEQKEKKADDILSVKNTPTNNENEVCRQIEELFRLKEKGILSQEEFDVKKKELLGRI